MAKFRVTTHSKSGNVLLDSNVNGKRLRLSTGKKADKRLLAWYSIYAEEEFWKLYYEKFGEDTYNSILFKDYGKTIVQVTKGNRNIFSQKVEEGKLTTLNKFFGEMSLEKIKPTTIQEWQSLMQEIRSPKTIREYRSTLNIIFEFAIDDEIIRKNPLKRVKPPTVIKQEVEFFNGEERETILQNSDGQLHDLLKFAFYSGLRAGEITGLKWENVDFKSKKINVCNRIRLGTEALPKGNKIRIIDLLPKAEEALLSQRQRTGLNEYTFLNRDGKKYASENCITQSIKLICEKHNIASGGLQKIRRSFNTMLKQNGLPSDWILHQMGHESEDVNRNHYTGKIEIDLKKLRKIV